MAQNLATKYSKQVDEVFRLEELTHRGTNKDYDWNGVNGIYVYGVATPVIGNYNRTAASNRYGTPAELDTTQKLYSLTRDRSFTFVIDRRNREESQYVTEAGAALKRTIEVAITPEMDVYRLASWAATATTNTAVVNTGATTSTNAYTNFLALNERLSNNSVPIPGRQAYMTFAYYSALKLSGFVLASNTGQDMRGSGLLGNVDGVEITAVPVSYMPTNTDLIICHPMATVAPIALTDYIIHENAPGYNGHLVEGRFVYDCFTLSAKINAVAIHKTA